MASSDFTTKPLKPIVLAFKIMYIIHSFLIQLLCQMRSKSDSIRTRVGVYLPSHSYSKALLKRSTYTTRTTTIRVGGSYLEPSWRPTEPSNMRRKHATNVVTGQCQLPRQASNSRGAISGANSSSTTKSLIFVGFHRKGRCDGENGLRTCSYCLKHGHEVFSDSAVGTERRLC